MFAGVVVRELERNMADHLQLGLLKTNQRAGQTFDSSSLANSSGVVSALRLAVRTHAHGLKVASIVLDPHHPAAPVYNFPNFP